MTNKYIELATRIERLQIGPGDVVVVRCPDGLTYEDAINFNKSIKDAMAKIGRLNTLVLVLDGSMTIEALDEAQMREYGWVRVEKHETKGELN